MVLSLLAHVLFAAYATTVHIVRTHPHAGHAWGTRITAVVDGASDGANTGVKDGDTIEPTLWDIPAAEPVDPQMVMAPAADVEPAVSFPAEPALPVAVGAEDAAATVLAETTAQAFEVPTIEVAPPTEPIVAPAEPIEVAAAESRPGGNNRT